MHSAEADPTRTVTVETVDIELIYEEFPGMYLRRKEAVLCQHLCLNVGEELEVEDEALAPLKIL